MTADGSVPRWRGEPGFFEIWFVVAFDRRARRAWWFRYTTFAPREGAPRGTLWAAAFESGRPARWGKRFVPTADVHAAVAALGGGRVAGAVDGVLAWDLRVDGGDAIVRGPGWLHRVPAPTQVAHLRGEARVTGTVQAPDGGAESIEAVATVKHLWGTRRVEELFWVYCAALEDGGALEATGVRVRRGSGPRLTPVWLRTSAGERRWWAVPGLFRHRVEPDGPGRLRVCARSLTARVDAVATYDPNTLAGYVYRDPSGFDVHVAQSDVARCEVALRTRPHPLAAWGAPCRLAGDVAAVELHHPEPLANVRYIGWDAERPPEVTP